MTADHGILSMTHHKILYDRPSRLHQKKEVGMYYRSGSSLEIQNSPELHKLAPAANSAASTLGTTWPARTYSCDFCPREFRSAQALGGHMNVHRLDRARLRESTQRADCLNYPVHNTSASAETIVNADMFLFYPIHSAEATPAPHSGGKTLLDLLQDKPGTLRSNFRNGHGNHKEMDGIDTFEVDTELRLGY